VTDSNIPVDPPHIPPRKSRDGGALTEILVVAVAFAVAVALATWFTSSRQIAKLQHDVATLQDAHERLALQVLQARKNGNASAVEFLDVSAAPIRGRADAVVTLVEFSDYECPYCIRHFQQTMPLIEQNYIATGKIRYVFRDFPIDANHPQAIKAHEAAHCAIEQQKFWELHPRLFSAPGSHTPLALEDRAKEAGLDATAFRSCIASGRTTAGIRATGVVGENLGITGTPWFFVGLLDPKEPRVKVLKVIDGAQPYADFAAALDAALQQVKS
jgi:protein-disulfide isomerase